MCWLVPLLLQEEQVTEVAVARAAPSDELFGAVLKAASTQVLLWRVQHASQLSPPLQSSALELNATLDNTCTSATATQSLDPGEGAVVPAGQTASTCRVAMRRLSPKRVAADDVGVLRAHGGDELCEKKSVVGP